MSSLTDIQDEFDETMARAHLNQLLQVGEIGEHRSTN